MKRWKGIFLAFLLVLTQIPAAQAVGAGIIKVPPVHGEHQIGDGGGELFRPGQQGGFGGGGVLIE